MGKKLFWRTAEFIPQKWSSILLEHCFFSLFLVDKSTRELVLSSVLSWFPQCCYMWKEERTSACCSKQPQELTIPDGRQGTRQDSLFPVSPTHVLAKERVIFHYMGGKCHRDRTGALVGWERVENKVKAAWRHVFALLWGESVGKSGSVDSANKGLPFDTACQENTRQMCRCRSQGARIAEGKKGRRWERKNLKPEL